MLWAWPQCFGSGFIEPGSGPRQKSPSGCRRPLNPDPSYFLTLSEILQNYFIIIRFSHEKKSIESHNVVKNLNYFVVIYLLFRFFCKPLNPDPKHCMTRTFFPQMAAMKRFSARGKPRRRFLCQKIFTQFPLAQLPLLKLPLSKLPFLKLPLLKLPFPKLPFPKLPFTRVT